MAHHHNPLSQFEISYLTSFPKVAGLNLNFSNSALFMVIVVLAVTAFVAGGIRKRSLVPGRWQAMAEICYEFVASTVRDNVGLEGRKYFPFIFTLFMYILTCNLFGMVPYSFTVTSHIAVTFALAMMVFLTVTGIAFIRHGTKFFGYFLPHGTPWWLAPLMIIIEIFAYLARPISLSVRLFANMMAGHVLLKVIAGFILTMGIWGGWLPLSFTVVMTGFEIFVAILQAYIFTILSCVYLHDAIHLH